MKKQLFYVFLFSAFFTLILSCKNRSKEIKSQEIEMLMDSYHEFDQFNGAVLVAQGEKIIFKSGYGLANREWNVKNDTETKYRLGSITKQFTAALVLKLVEEK